MKQPVRIALSVALCLFVPGCKTSPPPAQPEPAPAAAPAPAPAPAASGPETWVGAVELPGDGKLRFIARLDPPRPDDPKSAWSGRLDIPAQSVKDFPLQDVRVAADAVDFVLAPPGAPENQWAIFSFEREAGADEVKGTLSQAGQSLPATARKLKPGEPADVAPKRPQEPKPPFPYASRDAAFTSAAKDKVALAGSFTLPEGPGPFPAVVLLTGSGAQDRDESLMGHRPFLVLADHLTRAGFAVLRFDDRGVGGSKGELDKATQLDLVGDARGALDWLAQQPEVDKTKLGLIGHSEGAMIAARTGAADKRVGAVVMLAGPGVTGKEILVQQLIALARARGVPQADIDAQVVLQKQLLDGLAAKKKRADLEPILRKLVALQTGGATPEQVEALVGASLASLDTPWFHDFLKADPRADLRKLKKTPVLALIGALDLQVPAEGNIPELEQALAKAGNKDATVKSLPGLNHLFQHAKTGSPAEYGDIEETMAPEALGEVSGWLRARWPAP
ncbi:S9 family peptidase [Nannocystis punicea]|uniref:Alpha/beta fold hydrolase n=1 Tax=Nannocystis punicea TaxID=2995304 RepID=A0ABY7HAE8_9BACT|nr:alpha/beta fold hydrolase [Nannocystis poenicansa]WAS96077.1 alpha/beta fold hydrolase [Nannocystis poenicansa]